MARSATPACRHRPPQQQGWSQGFSLRHYATLPRPHPVPSPVFSASSTGCTSPSPPLSSPSSHPPPQPIAAIPLHGAWHQACTSGLFPPAGTARHPCTCLYHYQLSLPHPTCPISALCQPLFRLYCFAAACNIHVPRLGAGWRWATLADAASATSQLPARPSRIRGVDQPQLGLQGESVQRRVGREEAVTAGCAALCMQQGMRREDYTGTKACKASADKGIRISRKCGLVQCGGRGSGVRDSARLAPRPAPRTRQGGWRGAGPFAMLHGAFKVRPGMLCCAKATLLGWAWGAAPGHWDSAADGAHWPATAVRSASIPAPVGWALRLICQLMAAQRMQMSSCLPPS